MRRIIQLIGLPGAGKTTAINKFLHASEMKVSYLDVRDFHFLTAEENIIKKIQEDNSSVIIESSCGFSKIPSTVICLKQPIEVICQRLQKRDNFFDLNYLSLLYRELIPADYKIKEEHIVPLLLKVFKEKAT